MHTPTNPLLSSFGDIKKTMELYRSLKFIVGFAVEINETNLFDDIILPYPIYLERYDFNSGSGVHSIPPCGQHDFHWQIRHPAVALPANVRHPQDVIIEIADRVGILPDLYRLLNHAYILKDDHVLEAGPSLPYRR